VIDTKNANERAAFRQTLLAWFTVHQRPLPWRQGYDPYQVWISEIMGQQTQMERVVWYFNRWLQRFPDLAAVANAPEQDILKAWEGLGYYSRARNLHRAAQELVALGHASIPADAQQLRALPGIGPYTAAAVLSIAFNQAYPLLDANVERLFARLFDIDQPLRQGAVKKRLATLADALLDREQPRLYNQGLMELGALVCTPKKPLCTACPLWVHCQANQADTVELRPLPSARQKKIDIVMACGILRQGDRVFIQQRMPDDVWGGLWEFPGGRLEEGEMPEQAARREIAEETGWQVGRLSFYRTVTHHYTRYRVTLHSFVGVVATDADAPVLTAASQYAWVSLPGLAAYPFPAGHRQLVAALEAASEAVG
jgi:A/G-specific adenine glycosylase